METQLLRTFVTVARLGSFSAAAEQLGYTQSAISQQIAALEGDLGVPLLTRRPVAPTEAGLRLLEHAEPLLLRVRAARADVLRSTRPASAVRLAATPLALDAAALPVGVVHVTVTDLNTAAAMLASGEADLALVDGVAAPSDPLPLPEVGPLVAVGAGEDGLVVALPPGHPLHGGPGAGLADLVDALWIEAPGVCGPLQRLRQASGLDGFRVGLRYDGCDVRALLALVAAGHGLALLPAALTPGLPLAAPRLVHRVELLHGALPPGPAADLAAALTG